MNIADGKQRGPLGDIMTNLEDAGRDDANGKRGPEFTIFVNNTPSTTSEHQLTGSQIKVLAGIPSDYELFEVRGEKTEPVGNDELVHIHNKAHFRAIPAGTFGCHGSAT
jgi:hypothetical protein